MNAFNKIFFAGHRVMLGRAGETCVYHYGAGESDTVTTKALIGSKTVTSVDADGMMVQYKQQYFAIDGNTLKVNNQLIKPADGHYIVCNGIRYTVVAINNTFFESPVPTGAEAGLLKIYTTAAGATKQ